MLKNFDPEFENLTDYILKITYRIWEERGVDKIRLWYGKEAPVYTPMGVTRDVEEVIRLTLQTLQMFPDRQLLGEDVIGADYSTSERGLYYSSHRILSPMTHLGDGFYGQPTGKKTATRIIADCVCEKNQVIKEWMVRDQSTILKDLGIEVEEFGRTVGKSLAERGEILSPEEYVNRWQGSPDAGKIHAEAEMIHEVMASVFQGKIEWLMDSHDRAARSYFPCRGMVYGVEEIASYFTSFVGSFTDTRFQSHHWIIGKEDNDLIRVALRWSLMGFHRGNGLYGPPSGAPLTVLGLSHFELRRGKVYRSFHLFDEVMIWAQIEGNKSSTVLG